MSSDSEVHNSLIAEGCSISGKIEHSIISTGCKIAKNATVTDSVIMGNTVIEEGAVIQYAIIGENCVIHKNAKIGNHPEAAGNNWGISVVGAEKEVEEARIIHANEII